MGPRPLLPADALRRVCPHCERVSGRLIRDRLCVSCYNRGREALKGKNAKGGRPRLCCAILAAHVLPVLDPGRTAPVGVAREARASARPK